jgi:hypothetical protein
MSEQRPFALVTPESRRVPIEEEFEGVVDDFFVDEGGRAALDLVGYAEEGTCAEDRVEAFWTECVYEVGYKYIIWI